MTTSLNVTTPSKIIKFETSDGSVSQEIVNLDLTGQKGKLIEIRPLVEDGRDAYINVTTAGMIAEFVKVRHSRNAGETILARRSSNLGPVASSLSPGNIGWEFESVKWLPTATSDDWMETNSWDSGVLPTQYDSIFIQAPLNPQNAFHPHLANVVGDLLFNTLEVEEGAVLYVRGRKLGGLDAEGTLTQSINNQGTIVNGQVGSDNLSIEAVDIVTGRIRNNVDGGILHIKGETIVSNDLTTTGGNLTIDGNVTLTKETLNLRTGDASAGNIRITGTVEPQATQTRNLVVNAGTGTVTFDDTIGATNPLATLNVNGSSVTFGSDRYTTEGTQEYTASAGENFFLNGGGDTRFTTLDAAITFNTANLKLGDGTHLVVDAQGGAITMLDINGTSSEDVKLKSTGGTTNTIAVGAIGTGTADGVHLVEVTAPGGITLNGSITTSNADGNDVTVTGPVTLGVNVTVDTDTDDNDGDIKFSGTTSTVNGAHDFILRAGTKNVTLEGAIGGTTPITGFVVNGGAVDIAAIGSASDAGVTGALGITGTTSIDIPSVHTGGAVDINFGGEVNITNDVIVDGLASGIDMEALAGNTGSINIGGNLVGPAGVTLDVRFGTSDNIDLGGDITSSGGPVWLRANGGTTSEINDVTAAGDLTFNRSAVGTATYNINSTIDTEGSVTINEDVEVNANESQWYVGENWNNNSSDGDLDVLDAGFIPGTSRVNFDTAQATQVTGSTTFYELNSNNSKLTNDPVQTEGKAEITFQAGSTQTTNQMLTLEGGGTMLVLKSTGTMGQAASRWYIDSIGGRYNISGVDVSDSVNLQDFYIFPYGTTSSINRTPDNNIMWFDPVDPNALGAGARTYVDPPDPPQPSQPEGAIMDTGMVSLNVNYVNRGKKKFLKDYATGRYKTVVIVFEGAVAVADYDDEGVDLENAELLTGGQSAAREGEIL
ncbi:beta strand repeat-containing protein [Candidatus Omnitrophota bacterium]